MLKRLKNFWRLLGPGLITGISDDDPSGIITYTLTGAQTGLRNLWVTPFTIPLMIGIQEMCARIGLVTGHGLAGNMRRYFPLPILWLLALIMFIATTINVGADLLGMAAATRLIIPVPTILLEIIIAVAVIVTMIFCRYQTIARWLKWLCFALLAYFVTAIIVRPDWLAAVFHTFVPSIQLDKNSLLIIVGVLGTTISPYLFFWQANEEVEDVHEKEKEGKMKRHLVTKHELKIMEEDVSAGMILSNLGMFFIITLAATVLFNRGITNIQTMEDAAKILQPLLGNAAYAIFTIGILGTGLLAIPVLAGSAAYIVAEVFNWREGLDLPFRRARAFYLVIIFSVVLGFLMQLSGIEPIKFLFYTAVLYGLTAPLLILAILAIANSRKIMGQYTNSWLSNLLGILTFVLMTTAAGLLLWMM